MNYIDYLSRLNYRPPMLSSARWDEKHLKLLACALWEHGVKVTRTPTTFDLHLKVGVQNFQKMANAAIDGVVGPETWAFLGVHHQSHGELVTAYARKEAFAGARESGGNNRGPSVDRYLKGTGMSAVPWCVAFASYCDIQAHKRLGTARILKERLSSSGMYREGNKKGFNTKAPRAGDYALLKNALYVPDYPQKGITSHKHTALFAWQDGDRAFVWEGNVRPRKWVPGQYDAVRLGSYPMKDMDFVETC